MVTGYHNHRCWNRSDRFQHLHDHGRSHCARVEQVTGNHHDVHLFLAGHFSDPQNSINSLLLQACLFLGIVDPAIGLADLPVSGVKDACHPCRSDNAHHAAAFPPDFPHTH
ncbi:MAG: Uncharacterised protein [Cyanobium sp. ARS6]|nr:MAG: Uncharacterised protein [Cyanobium sp. ARS6]